MIKASRKRKILAFYLDFLLFSSLIFVIAFSIQLEVGTAEAEGINYLISFIMAAIFSFVLKKFSPGRHFLSIDKYGSVSDDVKPLENYWTMTLATLTVISAAKAFWLQVPATPFLGHVPEGVAIIVSSFTSGAIMLLFAYAVFKMKKWAPVLGIGMSLYVLMEMTISKNSYTKAVVEHMIETRKARGQSVDERVIDFIQTAALPFVFGSVCLYLLVVFLNWKRFIR